MSEEPDLTKVGEAFVIWAAILLKDERLSRSTDSNVDEDVLIAETIEFTDELAGTKTSGEVLLINLPEKAESNAAVAVLAKDDIS